VVTLRDRGSPPQSLELQPFSVDVPQAWLLGWWQESRSSSHDSRSHAPLPVQRLEVYWCSHAPEPSQVSVPLHHSPSSQLAEELALVQPFWFTVASQ
jgi:hypothetical protein